MGYSAPTTITTGQLVTASLMNTDWGGNIAFLANPPACRVYHNTTQAITNITETTLAFNSERFDTSAMHDTVTNNSRITMNTAGLYLVSLSFELASAADYRYVMGVIRMNGNWNIALNSSMDNAVAVSPRMTFSTVYKFAAADYVEGRVYFDRTGLAAANVLSNGAWSPELSAVWVGLG